MVCKNCGVTLAYNPHTGGYFGIANFPTSLASTCANPHVPE